MGVSIFEKHTIFVADIDSIVWRRDLKLARDLTSLEVLEIAIRAKMDSAALYRKMGNMVRNKNLQARLAHLESEEKKQRAALERLFEKMFPETEPKLPRQSFTPVVTTALNDDVSVKELIHAAMESEKVSELFYRDLARKSTDIHGS